MPVRLGSVEEGYELEWLLPKDREFLANPKTSHEASVLSISDQGITVVGKRKWGMLYGVQTVNQLIRGSDTVQGLWRLNTSLPWLTVRDWPDLPWRCLSPQMTWYSGYNRLEGYDNGNWTLDEWKWLVDWSLLHKCNGWALCMYGNWPFTVPGYEETTLDVDSFFYNPQTGNKEPHRFMHRNIQKEFLPELIRYANQRGVKSYAHIGKNSFNGTYGIQHPDANAGGAAELIPFHPGVHEYWEAFIRRIIEIGFDGFVFEDPEALHVPNQNAMCYATFWEPWAETYGFKSVEQTDQNNPPLGVQVEYYSWLFRVFDEMIQKYAAEAGRPQEIYLISHVLLSRMVSESKTQAERDKWFAYIDQKQGQKVRFIIMEADEEKYVSFLGHDRVASLGGRGGSCTNAMRRIASINNNWCGGGMGGDLAYERQCQKHICEAGGFGAMGYVFEWTNTEVFGYLGAQYLWRNAGIPGINNDNQVDFLDYAYRMHYGDKVGGIVARIMDESSCVNDAMMLDGVYGSQYPSTGAALHRDYQYLAVQADRAVDLATEAFQLYTGREPDLYHPVYAPEEFRWNGFDPQANKTFNAERLRLLYVSTRRSQKMCAAVLAHRLAQRLTAEGAPAGQVLTQYERALEAAKANQLIYQLNYDDDCDGKERPFDGERTDSTGATFKYADPGIIAGLKASEGGVWQWVDGFAEWVNPPAQRGLYRCYLGVVEAGWVYARQDGELSWLTAAPTEKRPTAVAFVGGTGYGPGKAELWCDGKRLLEFETSRPRDGRWEADGVELRYLHGGDIRNETTTFGISGVYLLRLPASHVNAGQPLNLVVRVPAVGGGDWFMVHEYRDVAEATAATSIPSPHKPTITAFTPHLDGKFGVTIADYAVELDN